MKNIKRSVFSLVSLFIVLLVGLAFAVDTDQDGMSDLYEDFFGLNYTNSADAAENYDCANDQIMRPILGENRVTHDNWVFERKPGRSVTYGKQNETQAPTGVEAQPLLG